MDGYKYEQCNKCGKYHLLTQKCPEKAAHAAADATGAREGTSVTLQDPHTPGRLLRPWEGREVAGACATLVVRARPALPPGAGGTLSLAPIREVIERGRTIVGELWTLLVQNAKGHTGRRVAAKPPVSLRVQRRINAGVVSAASLIALTLGS